MKAMILTRTGSLEENPFPLLLVEMPTPVPTNNEVLIRVMACGVCHTELDEIEGRTSPPKLPVIPGHEVIGMVEKAGSNVTRHQIGDRVGVGWIFRSDGTEKENLSPEFRATGRDANGGYAEFMTVHEDYAFPIPEVFTDEQAAPLMCAGAIGYRALRLTNLVDGQPLGLTGFGGSAHIVIQLVKHLYPGTPVYVFARDRSEQQFALDLGAVWAGDTVQESPVKLQVIIDTTPAWTPVIEAMKNLGPGGRLVINAIRKQDTDKNVMMKLDYAEHLWMEREIKTVANISARDIAEFLPIAAEIPIVTHVQTWSLEDANRVLVELKRGSVRGAKVLTVSRRSPP